MHCMLYFYLFLFYFRLLSGMTIQEIMPFKVGDYILLKDPWGIGPKDQPVGDRFFSFVKAERIGAVFRK